MSVLVPPGLTGARIDRSDAMRTSPEALADARASLGARLLRLDGLDPVLADQPGTLSWGLLADAPEDADLVFLGMLDGKPRFAAVPPPGVSLRPSLAHWRFLPLLMDEEAALYAGARSLVDWHMRHRFCAACGAGTVIAKGGWQRDCTGCGANHFPRVDPVVIMLAHHDGAVLVGRQHGFPPGRYSALAGFVEPGESMEDAVRRELHEEAGLAIGAVRYVASQPWPFPSSLMIACMAEAETRDLTLDSTEIEDAFWVDRPAMAAVLAGADGAAFLAPPPYAIARTLLDRWGAGLI